MVGKPFIVNIVVADEEHPLALVTVYEIIAVPDAIAVTKPFAETVAIALFDEDQTPPTVEFINWRVVFTQIESVKVADFETGAPVVQFDAEPVKEKLPRVPFSALDVLSFNVVSETLFPLIIPWLKL